MARGGEQGRDNAQGGANCRSLRATPLRPDPHAVPARGANLRRFARAQRPRPARERLCVAAARAAPKWRYAVCTNPPIDGVKQRLDESVQPARQRSAHEQRRRTPIPRQLCGARGRPLAEIASCALHSNTDRRLDHWLNTNTSMAVGSMPGIAPPLDVTGLGYMPLATMPGPPLNPVPFQGLFPATPAGMGMINPNTWTEDMSNATMPNGPPTTSTMTDFGPVQGFGAAPGLDGMQMGAMGVPLVEGTGENSDEYWNALIDGEFGFAGEADPSRHPGHDRREFCTDGVVACIITFVRSSLAQKLLQAVPRPLVRLVPVRTHADCLRAGQAVDNVRLERDGVGRVGLFQRQTPLPLGRAVNLGPLGRVVILPRLHRASAVSDIATPDSLLARRLVARLVAFPQHIEENVHCGERADYTGHLQNSPSSRSRHCRWPVVSSVAAAIATALRMRVSPT